MAGKDRLGDAMVPVERVEMATQDTDAIAEFIDQQFVGHRARFRCPDPSMADASTRTASAGPLHAALIRWAGVEYEVTAAAPAEGLLGTVPLQGAGMLTTAGEEYRYSSGDAYLAPPYEPYGALLGDTGFAVVEVPWQAAGDLAEEKTGLPAGELRFESVAPVSKSQQRVLAATVEFICDQLVASGVDEVHPLVAREMTELAAAALVDTFPNTAMTSFYLRDPGWVPEAAVRTAGAFIETHADQPVTNAEIAAAAGVTVRDLQHAFRHYCETTPTAYLHRVRLERAHQDLSDAGEGMTVDAVAGKWGWASPAQFTVAYQRRFGVLPSQTLRG